MLNKRIDKFSLDRRILLYIAAGIIMLGICIYLKDILHGLSGLLSVITPLVMGFLFAFILNVLMRFLETRFLDKIVDKHPAFGRFKRIVSLITTYLLVCAFLALFFAIVLPQFIISFSALASQLPAYVEKFAYWLNDLLVFYNLDTLLWTDLAKSASQVMNTVTNVLKNAVPNVLGFTASLANGILNVVFGLIFSIYMLAGKEKLISGFSRFCHAFLPQRFNKGGRYVADVTNDVCSNFIQGQCLDALCLGLLSFIVLTIMQMPYPLVIAVTLACTNLIPVIGPWLGSIPCAVITFVISPFKALILVITIIILQEVENKLIYPKIVGSRVGIDGIWVLIGVICGGELGGLIGILLGVPVVAVLYRLTKDKILKTETEKKNPPAEIRAESELSTSAED